MGVIDRLVESVDGTVLSLSHLFGRDTTPRRPGEPLIPSDRPRPFFGSTTDNPFGTDQVQTGLYPNLPRESVLTLLDEMDSTGLAASVLDMQTEDALATNPDTGRIVSVKGNKECREAVERCFRDLRLEDQIHQRIRMMCLYGSEIVRLVYSKGDGVTHLVDTDIRHMKIDRDSQTGELKGYKQQGHKFRVGNAENSAGNDISWPWDFVHFKIPGKRTDEPYGRSILASGIRPWTQMVMAEDAALMYRISRAPDRLLVKLDVGAMPEAEAWSFVQEFKRKFKRKITTDPTLGRLRQEYNPLGPMEDIFLGVRPDSGTDISVLQGSSSAADVTDVNYFAKSFLNTTNTPPPIFGFYDTNDSGNPVRRDKRVTNQDIRYARHIMRVQKSVVSALMWLAKIHLRLLESNPESPRYDWRGDPETGHGQLGISLQPPSFLLELERLEVMQLRTNLVNELLSMGSSGSVEAYEWTLWVFKHVLQLDDNVIKHVVKRQIEAEEATERPVAAKSKKLAAPPVFAPTKRPPKRSGGAHSFSALTSPKAKPTINAREGFHNSNGGDLSTDDVRRLLEVVNRSPAIQENLSNLSQLHGTLE